MKKAGTNPAFDSIEAGYFLSILSADFFSDFFFSDFFLLSFLAVDFLSILSVLASDFFSILSILSIFLSCATAAKLMAANTAATRTAKNCFIVIPFSGCIGRPALGAVRFL